MDIKENRTIVLCPDRDSNPGHGLERAGCLAAALSGHKMYNKKCFLKLPNTKE